MENQNINNILLSLYPSLYTSKHSYAKDSYTNLGFVNLFDPEQFDSISETKTHLRYNCPYCLKIRGKDDNDSKFYWDKAKLVGYCFKCHSVGILKTDKPIEDIKYELVLNSFFQKQKAIELPEVCFETLNEIDYFNIFDPLDEEGLNYLNKRIPKLYEFMSNYFKFRVLNGIGVVLPIILYDKIISYNLRYYNPKNKMKYYIPAGVKYLYSPNNIFKDNNKYCEITLVEGIFDACAALILGIINPVCIFGSSLSHLQIQLLRKLSPSIINIQLDETTLSYNLFKHLKNAFPTVQKINVKPARMDSEEFLLSILLKNNPKQLKTIIERINFLVRN